MTGLHVGLLLTGAVVETVFAWPGLGRYTARALQFDDFPAVMGVTLSSAIIYVVVNAIVDILQLVADPRLQGAFVTQSRQSLRPSRPRDEVRRSGQRPRRDVPDPRWRGTRATRSLARDQSR